MASVAVALVHATVGSENTAALGRGGDSGISDPRDTKYMDGDSDIMMVYLCVCAGSGNGRAFSNLCSSGTHAIPDVADPHCRRQPLRGPHRDGASRHEGR